MMHPGKKLLFMGQDLAEFDEWNEERSVEWNLLKYDDHKNMHQYVTALNEFYKSHPALYELDESSDGFEWINNISGNENTLVFLRKAKNVKDMLVVVCNFSGVDRKDYKIGVPYPGKYKEIFNSDLKKFGGNGYTNAKAISSELDECDEREESIKIISPAFSVVAFSYIPFTEKEKAAIEEKRAIAKQRREESQKLQELIAQEDEVKEAAIAARAVAQEAELVAKDALKKSMDAAQKAQDLEKRAKDLENKRKKFEEEMI